MRIVVKVGTSTLAHSTGRLNIRHTEELVKVLSDLKNAGHEVILVSSGAIGMGVGKLSLSARPTDMSSKQACAAVGQCELMYTYDKLFNEYNHTVAQVLLTGEDVYKKVGSLSGGERAFPTPFRYTEIEYRRYRIWHFFPGVKTKPLPCRGHRQNCPGL